MGNDMEKMLEMLMAMLGNSSEDEELNEIPAEDGEAEQEGNELSEETTEDADTGLDLENLLGRFTGGKDKRVTLLSSIKPYMNEKRQEKVDVAINLVRLISVSSSLGINLFDIGR